MGYTIYYSCTLFGHFVPKKMEWKIVDCILFFLEEIGRNYEVGDNQFFAMMSFEQTGFAKLSIREKFSH